MGAPFSVSRAVLGRIDGERVDGERVDGEPSPEDAEIEAIRASITKIICDTLQISPATLAATQNLRQLESVDSINLVRVMARIEDQFDIELEDDLVFEVTTLDELVSAVRQLASGHSVAP